jgi:hypothetical protein
VVRPDPTSGNSDYFPAPLSAVKFLRINFNWNPIGGPVYPMKRVILIVQFEGNEENTRLELKDRRPVALRVVIGKRTLRLPDEIQSDLAQIDMATAKFTMDLGEIMRLTFNGKLGE